MTTRVARRARITWATWAGVLLVVTLGLLLLRPQLGQAHVALVYLLVVLGGSAAGGRALGVSLACASFILIDYLFQPPFNSMGVGKRPDWMVLIAFLAVAAVATQLLARATAEAEDARQRAREIDRLSSLGAETLNVGRAEEALGAIARVITGTIPGAPCRILVRADSGLLVAAAQEGAAGADARAADLIARWAADHGRVAIEDHDGIVLHADAAAEGQSALDLEVHEARGLYLPLVVHGRTVGVLHLAGERPISLDAGQRRFLGALSYYAALGIERMRLAAEAEHAAALREADRLKDALLASVSHDLRTPLTTIKGLAHAIAAAGEPRAAVIERQADRLNHLVADLLDLSRLNGGALPVRPELNAAEDLVGAAIQQIAGARNGREIRTAVSLAEPVLVGRFDFVHSLRVVVNLLENALRYSPPESAIDLDVGREGDQLAITVADRGPGVPAGERELIFAPFYRRARTASDSTGGAGLGLAISRGLAAAQGGTLSYTERPGGGSCFTLRLPLAAAGLPEEGDAEGEERDVPERDVAERGTDGQAGRALSATPAPLPPG